MKFKTILLLSAIAVILGVISFWMGQLSYSWLPPQASVESQLIDNLFSFLVTIGTFIFLGVTGALVYSVLFHRAGKYDTSDGPPIEGNLTLEIVWTAIPFLLVLWIAIFSYQTYKDMAKLFSPEVVGYLSKLEKLALRQAGEFRKKTNLLINSLIRQQGKKCLKIRLLPSR